MFTIWLNRHHYLPRTSAYVSDGIKARWMQLSSVPDVKMARLWLVSMQTIPLYSICFTTDTYYVIRLLIILCNGNILQSSYEIQNNRWNYNMASHTVWEIIKKYNYMNRFNWGEGGNYVSCPMRGWVGNQLIRWKTLQKEECKINVI